MDWFEVIHLRSRSGMERDRALKAFQDLLPPDRDAMLEKIALFQDRHVENDSTIYILWSSRSAEAKKSPLGLQLAAAFSEFGRISHTVWTHEASIHPPHRSAVDEHSQSL